MVECLVSYSMVECFHAITIDAKHLHFTVPVKGIAALHAHKARVLHAHYTQCPLSIHAVSTHLTRKYTKMRVT